MPGGKQPIHVWINGVEFLSMADAYAEIDANSASAKRRAREAMQIGGTFVNYHGESYRLSLEPLENVIVRERLPAHIFGEPLLRAPINHRLGVAR